MRGGSPIPIQTGEKRAKEQNDENEQAGVWFSGLQAVAKHVGIKQVWDLSATPFYLSGKELTRSRGAVAKGSQTLLTGPAGAPTSVGSIDVVGSQLPIALPELDLPGTAATWTTPTLTSPLTVVGSPNAAQIAATLSPLFSA